MVFYVTKFITVNRTITTTGDVVKFITYLVKVKPLDLENSQIVVNSTPAGLVQLCNTLSCHKNFQQRFSAHTVCEEVLCIFQKVDPFEE